MSNLSLRLLFLLVLQAMLVSSFAPMTTSTRQLFLPSTSTTTSLKDTENPWEGGPPRNDESLIRFQQEETLLQINCKAMHDAPLDGVVIPRVQDYIQNFLFKSVLPVQHLQTIPTEDGGVELLFWRPAFDQSHVDGGMRFFVLPYQKSGLQIVVKRQSEGSTCRKSTTEKLVVQAFVKAFVGKDREKQYTKQDPPTHDVCTMESVFHKWMFSS